MTSIRARSARIPTVTIRGVKVFQSWLTPAEQQELVFSLREIIRVAPLFSPVTRFGKAMSVRMTSAGKYGWFSDRSGYRYESSHPNGARWSEIPPQILDVWHAVTGLERRPDCCLINHYGAGSRMGLHQDRDEADFTWPVVSISLGDDALFRIGNLERGGKTQSIWLKSGDVAVMAGPARLLHHGIDRIRFGSSALLSRQGRINLTLRVVD